MQRLIAIGDIHGQRGLLTDLLDQIQPTNEDQLVFLGDYVDRGPDSCGVIEDLLDLQKQFPQTVFLRGNHEQLFLDSLVDCDVISGKRLEDLSYEWAREMMRDTNVACFKRNGGDETLKSYGVEMVRDRSQEEHVLWPQYIMIGNLPEKHIEFIQQTTLVYQQDGIVFVHAGIDRFDSVDEQDVYTVLWDRTLGRAGDGKTLIIGHTPCPDGEPLMADDLIMLDTGAAYGRALSAIELPSRRVWQAEPKYPGWLSTTKEPPKHTGKIELLDIRTKKGIPAYFDGQDCILGSSKTVLTKFGFWRPVGGGDK